MNEPELRELCTIVDEFMRGEREYWSLHDDFMAAWARLPDNVSSPAEPDPWSELYELIYMGSSDPVPPRDGAHGIIGETELRQRIGELRPRLPC